MTGGDERQARADLVSLGRALYDRGITPGRTGNLSVRVADRVVMTPTGGSLGRLEPDSLSLVGLDGQVFAGPAPTKEGSMHLAQYRRFPAKRAVAHVHSTHAVAWSCRADTDATDALPPLTAYYAMRVGRLPMLPYLPPGDPGLAEQLFALNSACALLANHGSIAAGADLEAAVDAVEEIEETARIALLLLGCDTRPLTTRQVVALKG